MSRQDVLRGHFAEEASPEAMESGLPPPSCVIDINLESFGLEPRTGECRMVHDATEDLCTVTSMFGIAQPISGFVPQERATINWLHYRGLRHSPFRETPNNLKSSLRRWRAFAKQPQKVTKLGKEPVHYCHVCGRKFELASHRENEEHRKMLESVDFSEFDRMKAELESVL